MARRKIDPNVGKKFSEENQPSPESKSKGWQNKRIIKKIAESVLSGDMKDVAEKIAKTFGLNEDDLDLATLADLKQLEKAIIDGDTKAYTAFMDRLRGKPKQTQEITLPEKRDITVNFI